MTIVKIKPLTISHQPRALQQAYTYVSGFQRNLNIKLFQTASTDLLTSILISAPW